MNKKLLTNIVVLVSIIGCSQTLPPEQYIEYFKKNNKKYSCSIERNGFVAQLQYIPKEYYAATEMIYDTSLQVKEVIKKYRSSLNFRLSIGPKEENEIVKRAARKLRHDFLRKKYLTGELEKNVFILLRNDTITPSDITYEKNNAINQHDSYLLCFSKRDIGEDYKKGNIYIRNIFPQLGTLDFKLNKLISGSKRLKG